MKKAKRNIIFRFLWVVLALHILNVSIDTPDPKPDYIPEDLKFNDIESLVELVIEKALGIDNAIVELDEPDDLNGNSVLIKKIDFFFQQTAIKVLFCFSPSLKKIPVYYQLLSYSNRYLAIYSPPPEV